MCTKNSLLQLCSKVEPIYETTYRSFITIKKSEAILLFIVSASVVKSVAFYKNDDVMFTSQIDSLLGDMMS